MTRTLRVALLSLCLMIACAHYPAAHEPSQGFVYLSLADDRVEGRIDLALRDLEVAVGLDANSDGALTWDEIAAREDAIGRYILGHLALRLDDQACRLELAPLALAQYDDSTHAAIPLRADCQRGLGPLTLDYAVLFESDPLHRVLLTLEHGQKVSHAVLTRDSSSFGLPSQAEPHRWQVGSYFTNGVWHIWLGLDHIIFLFTLLLPAVLRHSQRAPANAPAINGFLIPLVQTVTAFTVAHSLSLALAVFDIAHVPARLTEALIAGSIVVAALNNLWPMVTRRLWLLAFLFGLAHGLGFAGAMDELDLPTAELFLALMLFNLGVEAGQLAVLAALLPALFILQRQRGYPQLGVRLANSAIAAIGMVWLIERALNITILTT